MKYCRIILIVLALVILTACGTGTPTTTTQLPSPTLSSATALPTLVLVTPSETSTPQVALTESETNLPPEPISAPEVSAQPASASQHKSGEAIKLDSITMNNVLNGWSLSGGEVLVTTDGAQTWREVTPPEVMPPDAKIQVYGTFLDAQHAWVIFAANDQIPPEAVVWQTADAGHTWSASAPLNHTAYGEFLWAEFSALDATHLWLMMRGVYLGAGTHYAAQFFRTTDGGRTWLLLVGDVGVNYTGLVFADADHGLLTWQTTGAYAPSPPEYAVTTDGATNWDVRGLPPPSDALTLFVDSPYCEPYQPHLLSDHSTRVLVGCFDTEYNPPQVFSSYLYSSEDGGSTWTSTHLPDPVLASNATLFFFNATDALLLGRDIYRSTNGGLSWNYVKSVNWDGQFTFVDPQTGWAIARAGDETALVKTSNGGALWLEIKPVIAP
ncbi:MAG: hypothetical protein ABI904_08735 [Chloroflexota bacterium]